VTVVNTTHNHRATAAGRQIPHGMVERHQRRGAGGVDGVGGTLEVEAVGDARGGQVGHQADGGLWAFGAHLGLKGVADLVDALVAQLRHQLVEHQRQLSGHPGLLVQAGRARVEVAASPDDHPNTARIAQCLGSTGIAHRLRRQAQCQQLVGLGIVGRHRHHTKRGGVEVGEVVDEPTS